MQAVKAPRYTTPLGVAQYPWLVEPDTKFNPDGDYKVNMLFGDKDNEHLKFILKDLANILEEYYQGVITDPKYAKVASKIQKADIYEEDTDGNIVMKFKQKAILKSIKVPMRLRFPCLIPRESLCRTLSLEVALRSSFASLWLRTMFRLPVCVACLFALSQSK